MSSEWKTPDNAAQYEQNRARTGAGGDDSSSRSRWVIALLGLAIPLGAWAIVWRATS